MRYLAGISKAGAALALLVFSVAAAAWPVFPVTVVRVIDGDTVVVNVPLWPEVYVEPHIRVYGINAPEIHTKVKCEKVAGDKATAFAKAFLAKGPVLLIIHPGDTKFYGRMDGQLFVNGQSLGQAELDKHLAVPYHGGKRKPWCG